MQFTFRNNNCYTPIAVSIEGIYYLDENMEMKKCEQVEIARNVPERIFFDCHSPTVAFYGMSSNILKHDYYKNNSMFTMQPTTKVSLRIQDFFQKNSTFRTPRSKDTL